jgi:lipopolysaccharide export system protein LptA
MRIADEGQIKVVDYSTITTLLEKSTPTFSKSSLLDIAEKLEADFLVLGSVTKIGENISLDTYLFNPRGTPSFSKSFAEGKNLNAIVKEMGTKINSQVLKNVLSHQKSQATEEKGAPEVTGDTEQIVAEVAEHEAFLETAKEDTEEQAAIIEEETPGPVVAYTDTDSRTLAGQPEEPDSDEDDLQPADSLIEEAPEEIVAEEARKEVPLPKPVDIIEAQAEETPEDPEVAYTDTDSRALAGQPEELNSVKDDPQLLGSPLEEAGVKIAAEKGGEKTPPEAVDDEDRETIDVLAEIPEEEDAPTTVALLKEPDRGETGSTEKESEDKSFSSPFSTLKPVKITSKTMEADNKRNMVTFKGDVVVKQEDIVIFSDTMKVSYEPKGGINKVEASGNVKMSQENRIATGKKLVFYNPEQKIVMTGSPKIWQGDNLISCEKVTVLLEDNRIVFEGKVDSIIYPRSLQEKEEEGEAQVEEIIIPPLEGEPAGETVVQ